MDSRNSGSLQSSSGGDDEYDSRAAADSHSAFINNPIPNLPPPFFDPFSNYLNLNQNMAWPGNTLRSDPNPVPPFMPSFHKTAAFGVGNNFIPSAVATPPHNQNRTAAARNPRKRSRASRRAPTTVLTTDTANFRAMVQEFTGFPAPPFHNSPFSRTRFDLYGVGSTPLDAPPYLRRPFAQKVQSSLPLLSTSSNYQLQTPQNSNLFNNINQNPLLSSFIQANTNPKFPFLSSSIMGSKTDQSSSQIPSNDHRSNSTKIVGFDEFCLANQDNASSSINGLQNLVSSDQIALRNVENGNNPMRRDETTTSSSNFNGEKSPENVATKREGTVKSWICNSE